jgi:hypothetical protein
VGLCAACHHAVSHGAEVKPYALDLLVAEAVMLAAATLLLPGVSSRWRQAGAWALALAALAGPWLSYPSAFVLGAAVAALVVGWRTRRDLSLGRAAAVVSVLACASGLALWWTVARHQQTRFLQQWWGDFFPDVSSPMRAVAWFIGYIVHVGHYGATGLGVPLLILAVPGWVVLWRRTPAVPVLVAGPLVLAWAAGVLRVYPLADRLVFFAAPCLWLAAGAGAGLVAGWLDRLAAWGRPRSAGLGWLVLACAVLLPGAARMARELACGPVVTGFREAFAFVNARCRPGDWVWVCHPQVYEVYHGHPPWLLGAYTPREVIERAAGHGRVWAVLTPQVPGLTPFPDLLAAVDAAGSPATNEHEVGGLRVVLFEPGGPRRPAAAR